MPLYPSPTHPGGETIAPATDVPGLTVATPDLGLSDYTANAIEVKDKFGVVSFGVKENGVVSVGNLAANSLSTDTLYDAAGSTAWASVAETAGVTNLYLPLALTETTAPASPSAGELAVYAGTDHALHVKTSGGTDTALGAGGGGSTVYTAAYASAPGSPANGDWWYPSDGGGIYAARVSGAWQWFYKGFTITLPASSGWSWNNQRSSTVSTSTGTIYLHAPADSTDSWSMYLRTLPSTPYSLVFYVEPILALVNFAGAGVPLRKASTGDWIGFIQYANGSWRHDVGTGGSGNTITAATYDLNSAQKVWNWLKVTDDGTTRKYYYGEDGQNWELLYSHAHTAITTPDTYGLGLESRSASPVGLRLVSLAEYNSVI